MTSESAAFHPARPRVWPGGGDGAEEVGDETDQGGPAPPLSIRLELQSDWCGVSDAAHDGARLLSTGQGGRIDSFAAVEPLSERALEARLFATGVDPDTPDEDVARPAGPRRIGPRCIASSTNPA